MSLNAPPPEAPRRTWLYAAAIAAVVLIAALFLLRGPILERLARPYVERARAEWERERAAAPGGEEPPAAEERLGAATQEAELRAAWRRLTGAEPEWPGDLLAAPDCDRVAAYRADLCRIVEAVGEPGRLSCTALADAAEALVASPPSASGELRSAERLRANATHLLRVLSRTRLVALREVVDRAGEAAEPLALALYRDLAARSRCGPSAPRTARAAYAYAAYALTSLGGQAYLHRRMPRVEALAAFYALLVIDDAERRGENDEGIDLAPHVARVRALVEGQPLLFRERYLETLDALAERWPAE